MPTVSLMTLFLIFSSGHSHAFSQASLSHSGQLSLLFGAECPFFKNTIKARIKILCIEVFYVPIDNFLCCSRVIGCPIIWLALPHLLSISISTLPC